MLSNTQWTSLANYVRTKTVSLFDPGSIFSEEAGLDSLLRYAHKGFYVGVATPEGQDLVREGFLQDGLTSLKQSSDIVVKNLVSAFKGKDANTSTISTSTFHFTVITDVQYIADPMDWKEDSDGVYFMWGQNYKGLYLPYQIKKMGASKVEVLDKLCSWEAGLVSNLWRLPEGLVWRLSCQTYTA